MHGGEALLHSQLHLLWRCFLAAHLSRDCTSPVLMPMRPHRLLLQAYPLDLLRTRLAAQTTSSYYSGITRSLATIVRDEGFGGLYRGLGATLIQAWHTTCGRIKCLLLSCHSFDSFCCVCSMW